MNDTFDPDHSDDGYDEMRWHHFECRKLTSVSDVLCGTRGGDRKLTLLLFLVILKM